MWITSSLDQVLSPVAAALGNFDGVHRGHRRVIQPAVDYGRSQSLSSTVISFNPHPQEFFSGKTKALLTPLQEKVTQLEHLGVEQLVLLPFNQALASLSPNAFVEEILVKHLQAKCLSVGEDFHFGKQRQGSVQDLQAIATHYGIHLEIVGLYHSEHDDPNQERISSSRIRTALASGDLQEANLLLGRRYSLRGEVILGRQLGRTLGFPTANLQVSPQKFLPCKGVYAVWVSGPSLVGQVAGVMNIGDRPTVDGQHLAIEVFLFDWSGDLYGQILTVELEAFLRPEQKFASLEALKAQIACDCDRARQILA